jgi:PKD repeat protein
MEAHPLSTALRGAAIVALLLGLLLVPNACGRKGNSPTRPLPNAQPLAAPSLDSALAELETLAAPPGVDEGVFAQLKAELSRLLHVRAEGKLPAAAPAGPENGISDLALAGDSESGFQLTWRYRNHGDYDQNGKVGISDITPIAQHFGEAVPEDDDNALPAVIDGSGNGKVDIADVTAIAQSFAVGVASYSVRSSQFEWGAYTEIGAVGFGDVPGGETERKLFAFSLIPEMDTWYRVVPQDLSWNEGVVSNAVQFTGEDPPLIESVSPLSGTVGADTQFAAVVTGGSPRTYQWAFGGGAEPNTSVEHSPTVALGAAGIYSCLLHVENIYGVADFEFTLTVYTENTYGVSGTVAMIDGGGLADARVTLAGFGTLLTGDDGFYQFTGVPDGGPYALSASLTGWRMQPETREVNVAGAPVTGQYFTAQRSPLASFTAAPTSGEAPLEVDFDASASSDPDGGGIVRYDWDFDADGTWDDEGVTVSHMYTVQGGWVARLRVEDNEGDTAIALKTISVGIEPLFTIYGHVTESGSGAEGVTISLSGAASGETTTDEFGFYQLTGLLDGSYTVAPSYSTWTFTPLSRNVNISGTDPPPQDFVGTRPSYTVSGTLLSAGGGAMSGVSVALTGYPPATTNASGVFQFTGVYDGSYTLTPTLVGWTFTPASRPVNVSGANVVNQNFTGYTPPSAYVEASPSSGFIPLDVDFDASGSYDPDGGAITQYEWDWDGDGTYDFDSGNDPTVQHTYSDAGNYPAVVRVTDDEGVSATDGVLISATEQGNLPPVASLSADPTSGEVPLDVDFDAGGSHDNDGVIVKYEWDWNGDGTYDYDSGADPTVQHTYGTLGTFIARVRVTDNDAATDTDTVQIDANEVANEPPVAALEASPTSGDAPCPVDFDASGSHDDDGVIAKYEWDWDGDGTYDYDSDTDSTVSHTYYDTGTYNATVRVTDDDDDTDTASLSISVLKWVVVTVDSTGTTGQYTSLVLDSSDHPHISYFYETPGFLRYAHHNGTSWSFAIPDGTSIAGKGSSIALDSSEYPCISYQGSTTFLKYAWYNGTSWDRTPADNNPCSYTSIAIDTSDHPHIVFYRFDTTDLRYTYYNGSTWVPYNVETDQDSGQHPGIVLDGSGYPHVSYSKYLGAPDNYGILRYAFKDAGGWHVATADSGVERGYQSSIALYGGEPFISHNDASTNDLIFTTYSGGWSSVPVDTTDSVGTFTSIEVDSAGNPHISYYQATAQNLKYAFYDGADWQLRTIDSAGDVGQYTSLALDSGGYPHITYYDATNGDLKYAYVEH